MAINETLLVFKTTKCLIRYGRIGCGNGKVQKNQKKPKRSKFITFYEVIVLEMFVYQIIVINYVQLSLNHGDL